jgi:hypothetical protein
MHCLPCGTEMRFVGVVQSQAMVNTHELHTFECPTCGRTERRLVLAHTIGTVPTERIQLAPTSFPPVTAAIQKIILVSRNGCARTIRMFRPDTFSPPALIEKLLVTARNAWSRGAVMFCSCVSAAAPESADPSPETSTRLDMVGKLKIADVLHSTVSPKLRELAKEMINGPRREYFRQARPLR